MASTTYGIVSFETPLTKVADVVRRGEHPRGGHPESGADIALRERVDVRVAGDGRDLLLRRVPVARRAGLPLPLRRSHYTADLVVRGVPALGRVWPAERTGGAEGRRVVSAWRWEWWWE